MPCAGYAHLLKTLCIVMAIPRFPFVYCLAALFGLAAVPAAAMASVSVDVWPSVFQGPYEQMIISYDVWIPYSCPYAYWDTVELDDVVVNGYSVGPYTSGTLYDSTYKSKHNQTFSATAYYHCTNTYWDFDEYASEQVGYVIPVDYVTNQFTSKRT
jgi:hypothetical protein